jgi:hypothetical protein
LVAVSLEPPSAGFEIPVSHTGKVMT